MENALMSLPSFFSFVFLLPHEKSFPMRHPKDLSTSSTEIKVSLT